MTTMIILIRIDYIKYGFSSSSHMNGVQEHTQSGWGRKVIISWNSHSIRNQVKLLFSFFVPVAKCNTSCCWLQVITLQPMVATVVFLSGFKVVCFLFCNMEAFMRKALRLLHQIKKPSTCRKNVIRFYALQVMSLTKEQQSQNLFLKVGLLSIIHNNECIAQGKQLETSAKLRVFVSNISLLPLKRR